MHGKGIRETPRIEQLCDKQREAKLLRRHYRASLNPLLNRRNIRIRELVSLLRHRHRIIRRPLMPYQPNQQRLLRIPGTSTEPSMPPFNIPALVSRLNPPRWLPFPWHA